MKACGIDRAQSSQFLQELKYGCPADCIWAGFMTTRTIVMAAETTLKAPDPLELDGRISWMPRYSKTLIAHLHQFVLRDGTLQRMNPV